MFFKGKVNCGSHTAASCKKCPWDFSARKYYGKYWCNGDCSWRAGRCLIKQKGWQFTDVIKLTRSSFSACKCGIENLKSRRIVGGKEVNAVRLKYLSIKWNEIFSQRKTNIPGLWLSFTPPMMNISVEGPWWPPSMSSLLPTACGLTGNWPSR